MSPSENSTLPHGTITTERLWKRFRADRARRLLRDRISEFGRMRGRDKWRWVLRDINLEIEPGSAVGLVGANGIGDRQWQFRRGAINHRRFCDRGDRNHNLIGSRAFADDWASMFQKRSVRGDVERRKSIRLVKYHVIYNHVVVGLPHHFGDITARSLFKDGLLDFERQIAQFGHANVARGATGCETCGERGNQK